MPEVRKDPILDRWVIIAAERARRPRANLRQVYMPESGVCPFCAGNESMTPPPVLVLSGAGASIDGAPWSVRVVPNKYPALIQYGDTGLRSIGLYESMNAIGVHEVVIETPKHVTDLTTLSETDLEHILRAYRERCLQLRSDGRWQYALIYKNHGSDAGATLSHSHSQITALPMVPKEPLEEFTAAKKHYASAGRCIYCEITKSERAHGARIVIENNDFVVFCPFASRVAGETWIVPKRHASSFAFAAEADLRPLAQALGDFLKRLAARFHGPALNYFVHTDPLQEPENSYYHWHLEILPKLQYVAGFEWGSGVYMNSLAPEEAARLLREIAT
jgi:UDPglucose--hexose-1-phosphate uridylyltransferase